MPISYGAELPERSPRRLSLGARISHTSGLRVRVRVTVVVFLRERLLTTVPVSSATTARTGTDPATYASHMRENTSGHGA